MNLIDVLKELFAAQSEKIKDFINELKNKFDEELKNTKDNLSKNNSFIEKINEKLDDIDQRVTKIENDLSSINELDKQFDEKINSKFEELEEKIKSTINTDTEDLNDKMKNLFDLLGLDEIDPEKIKTAKSIDEALKDIRFRVTNPTVYDFLDNNFDKIKNLF